MMKPKQDFIFTMKNDKNIDDIIREFSLEILQNKERIKQLEQKNKEKEAFLNLNI